MAPWSVSTTTNTIDVVICSLSSGTEMGTRCSVALTSVIFRRYLQWLVVSADPRSKSNFTRFPSREALTQAVRHLMKAVTARAKENGMFKIGLVFLFCLV